MLATPLPFKRQRRKTHGVTQQCLILSHIRRAVGFVQALSGACILHSLRTRSKPQPLADDAVRFVGTKFLGVIWRFSLPRGFQPHLLVVRNWAGEGIFANAVNRKFSKIAGSDGGNRLFVSSRLQSLFPMNEFLSARLLADL